MTERFVWTHSMDQSLCEWLESNYGCRRPDPNLVRWRDATSLFQGATSAQIRKRFLGTVVAEKKTPLTEDEAAKLIECVEKYGFAWEDMVYEFEGRTGLYLKNYFYTAKRRYERRSRGMRYSSRIKFPTIDLYFERMAKENPDILMRGRKRSPEPLDRDNVKRMDTYDAYDASDGHDSSDAYDASDASDGHDTSDAYDAYDATDPN